MYKKYRTTLIVTSLIILVPVLVGLLLWNQLPDKIGTHFGTGNKVDGWSSKEFAVFGMPLMMLGIHLVCFLAMANDPKRRNINQKMMKWVLWLIPVISLITCLSCYAVALGYSVDIGMLVSVLIGILFMVLGNFLHKIKQNYTVGIKLPWTLNSEENWNRTHRVASWIWILCGLLFLINSVFRTKGLLLVALVLMIAVPVIYSFVLYKKGI